ncbi:MAG: PD40 domain-containing protein [Oscillospiraceae bacterium]|nr:PD40 domain-containing protein [Oscillospiraceae bacterium]
MIINKIVNTEASTFIGMNGGMIESPDGKRIVYAKKKDMKQKEGMEIWICNTDLTNHRHVYTVECLNHNGPSATFIDNSTVVFRDMSGEVSAFIIMDVDSLKIKHKIYAKESHRAENRIYPFSVSESFLDKNPDYPMINTSGIYTLDTRNDKIKMIMSGDELTEMVKSHGLTPVQDTVSVSHVQLNPSATSIMMRIGVKDCPVFGALGCVDIDTGVSHMIADKPVHQLWYDDNTYMATRQFENNGHIEMHSSYIARFSKDGEELEVLGGIGNHIDGNHDRTLFAGDRCYPGYSPDIYIYEKGNKKAIHEIAIPNLQDVVWKWHVHPNPSFSNDGTRLYFNMPVSENKTEASFIELI